MAGLVRVKRGEPLSVRPDHFRPVMQERWEQVAFVHWACHPAAVQRVLPPGLEVETFDGAGWVSLVGCVVKVTPPLRGVPGRVASTARIVEMRTYARGPGGDTGVWALALQTSNLAHALVGRAVYGAPVTWARTGVRRIGPLVAYRSRPRGRRSSIASLTAIVESEEPLLTGDATDLDLFLTARFAMWLPAAGGSLGRVELRHPPWALRRARLLHLEENLTTTVGLPPAGEPMVAHFSDGATARVGPIVRRGSRTRPEDLRGTLLAR